MMRTHLSHQANRRQVIATLLAGAIAARATSSVAQEAGPYTFVVIGTDKRTPDDPELSDVLMVARVDPGAGTVRALSIPRDLYVEIPEQGFAKINAAFNYAVKADPNQAWDAGAAGTVATIEHNFDLAIDGVAQTDMQVFPDLIDAVGGVDVDNPYDLGEPDAATNLIYPEGPLLLNGKEAIYYCRLRHQDGDGARVMRQHMVLMALLERLQDPAIATQIPDLIAALDGDVVRTTIPPDVQASLLAMIPGLTEESITFGNLDSQLSPGTSNTGAWIYQGD